MTQLAIDDEDSGELNQGEIVLALLLPADEQATEAVEPGVRHLDNPTTLSLGHIGLSFRPAIVHPFL